MKYIRTKDRIYEVVREIFNGKAYEVKLPKSEWWYDEDNKCYYEDSKFDSFHKKEVIKEADAIEELCDEFVIHLISKETKQEYHYEYDDFRALTNLQIKEGYVGEKYGAIWFKGENGEPILKCVAKMNEKGEFELL